MQEYARKLKAKSESIKNLPPYTDKGVIEQAAEESEEKGFSSTYTIIVIAIVIVDVAVIVLFSFYILIFGNKKKKKKISAVSAASSADKSGRLSENAERRIDPQRPSDIHKRSPHRTVGSSERPGTRHHAGKRPVSHSAGVGASLHDNKHKPERKKPDNKRSR